MRPVLLVGVVACVALADVGPPIAVLAPTAQGVPGGEQTNLTLVATDGGYLAAWLDSRRNARALPDLYVSALDPRGQPLDPAARPLIVNRRGVTSAHLACQAGVCLIAWNDAVGGWALRVSELGVPLEPAAWNLHTTTSGVTDPLVGVLDGGFLLAWGDHETLHTLAVPPAGPPAAAVESSLEFGTAVRQLALDRTDPSLVAVVIDWPDAGHLLGTWSVAADGRAAGPPVLFDADPQAVEPALTRGGATWLLSWVRQDISNFGVTLGARLDDAGVALAPAGPVINGSQWEHSPTAAFDGTAYVLAAYSDNEPTDLIGVRLDPATGLSTPLPLVADRGGREFPVLAPRGSDLLVGFGHMHNYYALLDLELAMLGDGGLEPPRLLTTTGESHATPTALANGTVVLTSYRATGASDVQLHAVDLRGAPRGSVVTLENVENHDLGVAVAWNGSRWVAAFRRWPEIHLQAFDPTGAAAGAEQTVRTDAYTAGEFSMVGGPDPTFFWSHFVGDIGGTRSFAVRTRDGVAIDEAISLGGNDWRAVNAVQLGDGYLYAMHERSQGLATARLAHDGGLSAPQVLPGTAWSTNERIVIDGAGDLALAMWANLATGYPNLFAQRLDAAGAPLGPPFGLFSDADAPWSFGGEQPRFGMAWTGTDWLVVLEVASRDGGTQRDLWSTSVQPDGTSLGWQVFSATDVSEEQPSVTRLSPGRMLVTYLAWEPPPGADAMRAQTRLVARVSDGELCLAATECLSRSCVTNVCCSAVDGGCDHPVLNDGGVPMLDAGAGPAGDGGLAARRLGVGCGCDGAPGGLWGVLLALAALRRRPSGVR